MSRQMLREWMDLVAENTLQPGTWYPGGGYQKVSKALEHSTERVVAMASGKYADPEVYFDVPTYSSTPGSFSSQAETPSDYYGDTDIEVDVKYVLAWHPNEEENKFIVFSSDNIPPELDEAAMQAAHDEVSENPPEADPGDYYDDGGMY